MKLIGGSGPEFPGIFESENEMKKLSLVLVSALAAVQANAAVDAAVSTAISTAQTDALTVAGSLTAMVAVIWGALFLYGDLLEGSRKFIVTDAGLRIEVPLRPWGREKLWAWKDINRVEVIIKRRDTHIDDVVMVVQHVYPGEISIDREDRNFNADLVRTIIERAKLRPDGAVAGLDTLSFGKEATYAWKR